MILKPDDIYIVIPTIRNLNFLESWISEFRGTNLIIVEDAEVKSIRLPKEIDSRNHFCRADIDSEFGKNAWIFSRFNSGIRSYGFWKAYKLGAKAVITLDDDCYPDERGFINKHLENLNFRLPEYWINTYPSPKWMYTRGIPYSVRNKIKVGVSHGLWSGAIDLDARTEIKLPRLLNETAYPPLRNIIPYGYFYPMCSMNLAFTRNMTPLMYFPMMGKDPKSNSWPYDRYDDIWAGIFSKKIMDHLGYGVISGSPIVKHKKASKVAQNHVKEKNGAKVNEVLWKTVSKVILTKSNPKECYIELAKKIKFPNHSYFESLKKAMTIWADLF